MINKSSITEQFLTKSLMKIVRRPTYITIANLHEEISKNAVVIDSQAGGANHGLLGMVITSANYVAYSVTAFAMPAQPPLVPAITALNAQEARQATVEHQHALE